MAPLVNSMVKIYHTTCVKMVSQVIVSQFSEELHGSMKSRVPNLGISPQIKGVLSGIGV